MTSFSFDRVAAKCKLLNCNNCQKKLKPINLPIKVTEYSRTFHIYLLCLEESVFTCLCIGCVLLSQGLGGAGNIIIM